MSNRLFEVKLDKNRKDIDIKPKNVSDYYKDVKVHFSCASDMTDFSNIVGVDISKDVKDVFYTGEEVKENSFFKTELKNADRMRKGGGEFPDYQNMPEYISFDSGSYHTVIFHFKDENALNVFIKRTGAKITDKTKYIWFPPKDRSNQLEYVYESDVQQQFPIYIISKGRYETSFTAKNLMWMGIKLFYIIVEEQEYELYKSHLEPYYKKYGLPGTIEDHLLILDKNFQKEYDTADPEGDAAGLPVGSGAARNFGWEHSIKMGYSHHWMMDDNIFGFYRLNKNKSYRVKSGAFFKAMEDFVLRHDNIAMAGPQYCMFVPNISFRRPLEWNTRCYSCNFIRNDLPIRWRCRYNEDTDLSLRLLKMGYSTVLFIPFLQDKAGTQSVKGGNTNTIYHIGTDIKSKALLRLHPDVTEVVMKYGRVHHYVNYNPFKGNNPQYNKDAPVPEDTEYGMKLVYTGDTKNQCRE